MGSRRLPPHSSHNSASGSTKVAQRRSAQTNAPARTVARGWSGPRSGKVTACHRGRAGAQGV
jgi:hypothetical protein